MDDIIRPRKEKPEPMPEETEEEAIEEEKPPIELKSSRALLKWEALEYDYVPKSSNWFWSVGIIAIGAIVAASLLGNILFAILVIIATLTIILYGMKKPRKVMFSFTGRGLQIENRIFPYDNLRSFWIHYEPPVKKLVTIEPKQFFMPTISVPLGNADPNMVRDHLLKFLKEERREESLAQTITRLFGF